MVKGMTTRSSYCPAYHHHIIELVFIEYCFCHSLLSSTLKNNVFVCSSSLERILFCWNEYQGASIYFPPCSQCRNPVKCHHAHNHQHYHTWCWCMDGVTLSSIWHAQVLCKKAGYSITQYNFNKNCPFPFSLPGRVGVNVQCSTS